MFKDYRPKSPSILNKNNHVPNVSPDEVEGVDYINITKQSNTELGRMLAPGYGMSTKTIFGQIGTIRAVMDFLKIPGYPVQLISKRWLSPKDISSIPKAKAISVPNYWAIVAYVILERINQDNKLKKLLKEAPTRITSFNTMGEQKFFNATVKMSVPNIKMGRYLAIVRFAQDSLIADTFTKEAIEQFVYDAKDDVGTDIFDGTASSITYITPTESEVIPDADESFVEPEEMTDKHETDTAVEDNIPKTPVMEPDTEQLVEPTAE